MKILTALRSLPAILDRTLFPVGSKVGGPGVLLLSLFVCAFAGIGCGNTLYLVKVNDAEAVVQEAREIGAEEYAPYEYYSADARLKEAKKQAAQAEYGNASQLSNEASEYARAAIKKSKTVRDQRGAPPQRTEAVQ